MRARFSDEFCETQNRTSIWGPGAKWGAHGQPRADLGALLGSPWAQKALLALRFKAILGKIRKN